jgi:hypothetical protein
MKHRMRFSPAVIALFVAAASRTSAIEFIRTEIPGTGVALNLPTDWERIPPEVIQRFKDKLASSSANPAEMKTRMNYAFAAQRKAEHYFEFPYLLVEIQNTGRISTSQLEHLSNNSLGKSFAQAEELLPKMLQGSKVNTPGYDPTTKRLWCEFSSTVAGQDRMHALSVIIPTELGFVEIYMYSKEEDFSSLSSLFREIGTHVELSSSLAYKPRWTDDPTISSIIGAVQGINWIKVAYLGDVGRGIGPWPGICRVDRSYD